MNDVEVTIFPDPWKARGFFERLATFEYPWAFDIETFDAGEYPSRLEVATDPCHPDFRVHGIAVAWGPKKGAYTVLKDAYSARHEARDFMSPAFASAAKKLAHNASFDHEGLVYNEWVYEIVNRQCTMITTGALSDGTQENLKLERLATALLGIERTWMDFDKSTMRDADIEIVARGAVSDTISTWRLGAFLDERMKQGAYL